jgi:trimeric autotransporter adhesin
LLVGAPFEHSAGRGIAGRETGTLEESGAAYLFTRQGGVWRELVRIKAPEPFAKDGLGNSVAFGGDDVFYVAASRAETSGAVHVFR